MKLTLNINLNWPKGEEIMTKITEELTTLTNTVHQTSGVVQSAIVLITGFAQKLADIAQELAEEGVVVDKLDELEKEITESTSALAAAVAANPLPAEQPAPVPEPQPAPTPEPEPDPAPAEPSVN